MAWVFKMRLHTFLSLFVGVTRVKIIFCWVVDLEKHEMTIYEEVAKMPPFQRKTLVLIGECMHMCQSSRFNWKSPNI